MARKIRLLAKAGRHPRQGCPVCVSLPAQEEKMSAAVLIGAGGEQIPVQVVPRGGCDHPPARGEEGTCLAWVIDEMAAGEEHEYRLEFRQPEAASGVKVEDDGRGQVNISIGEKPFTTYRYQGNPARPCFFPLLGPGGARVTRSWPLAEDVPGETRDHVHHRSLWVAHGDVNGADNWSEEEGHGYQVHGGFLRLVSGPVFGLLEARNDWTDKEGKKICEETRRLTVYVQPDENRLFDLEVVFLATEREVRFGDTKEGGIIAMRVATSMDGSGAGVITNSYGGLMEEECWGRRAQWCDYSGPVGGEILGITIMDHPGSFRYPTYWHVRDYGMYTANPFALRDYAGGDPRVDGSHVLPAGGCLRFRYRVYIHRGNAAQAQIAERYHDFINPPRVEVHD